MDPACGVIKEVILDPRTGRLTNPDGSSAGVISGYVTVSPVGGFDRQSPQTVSTDGNPVELTFPRPGHWRLPATSPASGAA